MLVIKTQDTQESIRLAAQLALTRRHFLQLPTPIP
jgi:hypothetical protein